MKLFRIAKKQYINDFSGDGARLYGGRWNKRGTNMLYFSTSLALSTLEILVHFNQDQMPNDLCYVEVEIPEKSVNFKPDLSEVEAHLRENPPHFSTKQFGTNWAQINEELALAVPSAILPIEYNIIVNPSHKSFSKLKTITTAKLELDTRLLV